MILLIVSDLWRSDVFRLLNSARDLPDSALSTCYQSSFYLVTALRHQTILTCYSLQTSQQGDGALQCHS